MINGIFSTLTIVMAVVGVLGPVGAIVAAIFAPAVAVPIIVGVARRFMACTLCVVVLAVVLAGVGSYWVGGWGQYDRGVNDTIARVARGDAKVVERAVRARSKLKDCQAQGLSWDQSTGSCR